MTSAADSDFLRQMAVTSSARDAQSRMTLSDAQQRSLLAACADPVPLCLTRDGFDVIAEIKKRSPAEGDLAKSLTSPLVQAGAYADGGAVALSVLTEPEQFSGSLDDLHAVAAALPDTPVMRKDFLVSRFQVREARVAGASGVLLIAAMLDAGQLEAMLEAARELDMFALLEVFDEADLDKALPVLERMGPATTDNRSHYLLGVNCRDLRSLAVNFDQFGKLAKMLPDTIPWVAESGLRDADQAAMLAAMGYRVALVGTLLMRSDKPGQLVRSIRDAGAMRIARCS